MMVIRWVKIVDHASNVRLKTVLNVRLMASPVLHAKMDMDMTRRQKHAVHAVCQTVMTAVKISQSAQSVDMISEVIQTTDWSMENAFHVLILRQWHVTTTRWAIVEQDTTLIRHLILAKHVFHLASHVKVPKCACTVIMDTTQRQWMVNVCHQNTKRQYCLSLYETLMWLIDWLTWRLPVDMMNIFTYIQESCHPSWSCNTLLWWASQHFFFCCLSAGTPSSCCHLPVSVQQR